MTDVVTAAMPEIAAAVASYWTTPHIGVGDSTTAKVVGQIDLQASTNKLRKACTSFAASGAVLTAQARFEAAEAAFAWNEVAIFKSASAGPMLVRKVQSIGTKPNTVAWTLELTVTFTAGN